jgi:superoxide dismutase, Cu-Zn family
MTRYYSQFITVLGILSASSIAPAYAGEAEAVLQNNAGKKIGQATFTQGPKGLVTMHLRVKKLTPGIHALHIHTKGDCTAKDFTHSKQHGTMNPKGSHAGDLPNLKVDKQGKAHYQVVVDGVTLGKGHASLFHQGGTAVVIHAKADDNVSDPAGAAGPRVACGVIQRKT